MSSSFKSTERSGRCEQSCGQDRNVVTAELPFLVTHWLANFGEESSASVSSRDREDAMNRIRRASSEIASAFSVLGAFGVTNRSVVQSRHQRSTDTSTQVAQCDERNAAYSDVIRRWPGLPASHLETVVESSALNTVALIASADCNAPVSSVVDSAYESRNKQNGSNGGQRLGDGSEGSRSETTVSPVVSSLQSPALMAVPATGTEKPTPNGTGASGKEGSIPHQHVAVIVDSDYSRISMQSALCTRKFLSLREQYLEEEKEKIQLERSINIQNQVKNDLMKDRHLVSGGNVVNRIEINNGGGPHSLVTRTSSAVASKELSDKLAAIKTREDTCEMVIAQLSLKLNELRNNDGRIKSEINRALDDAKSLYQNAQSLRLKYVDPFKRNPASSLPGSLAFYGLNKGGYLSGIITQQYGGGGSWQQTTNGRRRLGRCPTQNAVSLVRKAVLSSRLSHALTSNTHLAYPVYCLRFDRTGRYFLTGADDYLVKLFYLGPAQSCDSERSDDGSLQPRCNYGANSRGAVLVCTLRGHAGVICDIDVSMDNALLATASDDGDCRIWGLKDGCPVAILRGHSGGANMVSWSLLSPYRLATIGSDGLARMWDVREAALKRYGAHVGKRVDYMLPLPPPEEESSDTAIQRTQDDFSVPEPVVPPLPESNIVSRTAQEAAVRNLASGTSQEEFRVDVPPLPPGAGGHDVGAILVVNEGEASARNQDVEGAFVANDAVDEGVRLIAKLQHGDAVGGHNGPSRRSNRNANKIICVARCPLGGHFVTGSEDGLGRIWADEEDDRIDIMDRKQIDFLGCRDRLGTHGRKETRKSTRVNSARLHFRGSDAPSTSRLLATLSGHINAITDLQYSNAGDRILTASQRDGVVRVWSWDGEPTLDEHSATSTASMSTQVGNKFSNLKQVLIKLWHPTASAGLSSVGSQSSRRRGGTTSSVLGISKSVCDVAVWTSDDSKIVTSQCCLAQASGSKIAPGSQFLMIWDSHTGQCLMGIAGAHIEACSVLVPHPTDPSTLCSAGADGQMILWDLASGKRLLTHQNTVDHGPVEPQSDRGKKSGYLDGSFSPDGMTLVLTDDSGRVTIFDSLIPNQMDRNEAGSTTAAHGGDMRRSVPFWMKDQYFANDYYELYYDVNGYCIERGSQQPPYLAPRAARCSHSGVPYSEEISRGFRSLVGPLPLPEQECRWRRNSIRTGAKNLRRFGVLLPQTEHEKRGTIMGVFDLSKIVIINSMGDKIYEPKALTEEPFASSSDMRHPVSIHGIGSPPRQRSAQRSSRPLSSNFRWRDYDDILREEEGKEDDGDTDDEEFVAPVRRVEANFESSDDSSRDAIDAELSDEDSMSERRLSRRAHGFSGRRVQSARSRRMNRWSLARAHAVAFEQRSTSQPTRVSARQLLNEGERRPYAEPDSDEDTAEYLSTNNTPSGPHVEDYTVARHYFRMPKSAIVWNKWLLRLESKQSYVGTKNYAPQVGDSVVYVPRAHYDTIQNFPMLHPPWKNWPTNSAWPVVRCLIRDVRYRFPYEDYYRGFNEVKVMSVVAILTLEVTGIPEISQDRLFPWPKPMFISRQTRSSSLSFEVSVFQGSQADYIIPEQLYLWRLETLEAAIADRDHVIKGLKVVSYYGSDTMNEGEDPYLLSYSARLVGKTTPSEQRNDLHIRGSGYESLKLQWDAGGEGDISPWEIVVKSKTLDFPPPHHMNPTEKSQIVDLLSNVARRQDAQEWFLRPVDVARYSDYHSRVEVPMDFSFIQSRLETDYYTNKLSVLSDVKLIRDNCIKYNDVRNEMSTSANEIYEFMKTEINKVEPAASSPPQFRQNHSYQEAPRNDEEQPQVSDRRRPSLGQTRRAGRQRRLSDGFALASSLEGLPPPVDVSSSRNESRARNASDRNRRSRRNVDVISGTSALGEMSGLRTTRLRTKRCATRNRHSEASFSEDDASSEDASRSEQFSAESDSDGDDDTGHSTCEDDTLLVRRSSRRQKSPLQERQGASGMKSRTRSSNSRKSGRGFEAPTEESSLDNVQENVPSRRSSRLQSSPQQRSSPRRIRARCSYAEVESDDSGLTPESASLQEQHEDSGSSSDDGISVCGKMKSKATLSRPRRSNQPKRKRAASSPKKKETKKQRVAKKQQTKGLPELKEWPDIEMKHITDVANAVMERMIESDVDSVFAAPVAELHPAISGSYHEKIPNPMDYRTIMEDRIPCYQSIAELQNDLILVFRNCTTFNKRGSRLWSYAITMWEMLNEAFRAVCDELEVLLPRRW